MDLLGDLVVMTPPVAALARAIWSWVGSHLWNSFNGPTAGESLTFVNSRHTFDTSAELTLVISPPVFFIAAVVPQIR